MIVTGCGEASVKPPVKTVSDTVRKSDSLRISSLLEEAWKWKSLNPDSCRFYAGEAAEMARKKNIPSCESEAECRFGNLDEAAGQFASAAEHYKRAIGLDSIASNKNGMARDALSIGIIMRKTGRYDSALTYTQMAVTLWTNMPGKEVELGGGIVCMGNIYLRLGQMDKALNWFQQSLTLAEKSGSKQLEADACNSIGLVYEKQQLFELALSMYQRSLNLEEERKNNKGIAISCNNIGNIKYHQGQLIAALDWYQRSIRLKEEIHYMQGKGGTFSNIGLIYEARGDYQQALIYHQKSYVLQSESGEQQGTAISANNTGIVLQRLGRNTEAIKYFTEALQIAQKTGGKLVEMEVLKNLSEAYAGKGDYATAFTYTKKMQNTRDSVEAGMRRTNERDDLYKEERSRLKLLEKEREKQQAKLRQNVAEARQQQITLYAIITGVFLLGLLFFTLWRANRQKQRVLVAEINMQHAEELLRNQELVVLRSMLDAQEKERQRIAKDLHDRLGLKLSTARLYYSMVGKHLGELGDEERQQYGNGNIILDEACDELRKVAHNLVSGELMRFGLGETLERLCVTLTEASGLQIDFYMSGLDDRLDSHSELQIYQVVQELLTNVHRHAKATKAIVQLSRYNHTLNILVEDNGVGFQVHSTKPGIGLNNIRERVMKLNGTFQIDSRSGRGTTVSIDIAIT